MLRMNLNLQEKLCLIIAISLVLFIVYLEIPNKLFNIILKYYINPKRKKQNLPLVGGCQIYQVHYRRHMEYEWC